MSGRENERPDEVIEHGPAPCAGTAKEASDAVFAPAVTESLDHLRPVDAVGPRATPSNRRRNTSTARSGAGRTAPSTTTRSWPGTAGTAGTAGAAWLAASA